MKEIVALLLLVTITQNSIFSQKIKFGKVSKAELEEKYYPLDSSANAAYLYRKRNTYTTVTNGSIQLETTFHSRIKIYNKEGFEWATKQIGLFGNSSDQERVSSIKAITHSLIDGKIVSTKLSKKEIYGDHKSNNLIIKKFTMPSIQEGSIVEWTYKIYSPFFTSIEDIVVQHRIPVKIQESRVKLLGWFRFNQVQKGYYPFRVQKSTASNYNFNSSDQIIEVKTKNVPALVKEPYVNNMTNYTAAIQFEVAALDAPQIGLHKTYATNWNDVCKEIYKSTRFGGQLEKNSYFKDDLLGAINVTAPLHKKIDTIFKFLKNKMKWNDFYGKYTNKGVKKAYKEGIGSAAEINLILVAMLRQAGLNANPILISTRNHGISLFPTSKGFNYIIAGVEIQNDVILLDATEKYSMPDVLPLRDLNWQGRIVRKSGSSNSIDLFPKKHATENYFLSVAIDDEGTINGTERCLYTNLTALRNRKKNNNIPENELITKVEKENGDIEIDKFSIVNKENLAKPLIYQFSFESDSQIEVIGDKMYFSPLLFLGETENPFKLENRNFPIDYGSPWEDKYTVSIRFPDGYVLESKPESIMYTLPEGMGSFKFITAVKGDKLQVLASVKINSPIIASIYYKQYKEFYKKMIDKQLERVVLVKK